MHQKSVGDTQDAVHQAVDIAFSVADLIGNLFGGFEPKRVLIKSNDGSALSLCLDTTSQPGQCIPTFVNSSTNQWGVIHSAQPSISQVQGDTGLPLGSACYYLQPNSSLPFDEFNSYQRGLLTATLVDPSYSGTDSIPLAAVSGCDMTSGAGVQLGSQALFNFDGTGVTYQNLDPENVHSPSFTVTTAAPNRTFAVGSDVPPGATQRIPFPDDISGSVVKQINAVLLAPIQAFNPPTPGQSSKVKRRGQ